MRELDEAEKELLRTPKLSLMCEDCGLELQVYIIATATGSFPPCPLCVRGRLPKKGDIVEERAPMRANPGHKPTRWRVL